VGLARCIKTGMDCKGHPNIKMCGIVAGDEESFATFHEIFDPIISKRHGGFAPDAKHITDMDPANLLKERIDPTGNYTLTTRCRTGRSVRGFRLPPAIGFEERRQLEAVVVKGLLSLTGELKGDYFPLHGSRSYAPKPEGMTLEDEDMFRKSGNLFQKPDSPLLLSGGMGRHWPDARGIFANDARNFFVWVNEEDHLRIVSMEKGDNVHAIFARFAAATEGVSTVLKVEGYDFMANDHLGYILTCPSNLGTGLRAGTIVKVPLLSKRADFKKLLGRMGLQARGTGGVDTVSTDGRFDISNADRIGKSETHLVNIFIDGVRRYILWEQRLEEGEDIDVQGRYRRTAFVEAHLRGHWWVECFLAQQGCSREMFHAENLKFNPGGAAIPRGNLVPKREKQYFREEDPEWYDDMMEKRYPGYKAHMKKMPKAQ